MTTSPNNPIAIIVKATAAAPTYTEGDQVQASSDLSGQLRVLATVGSVTVSMDATATAAAPTYLEGTANPLSQTLTGDLRTVAKIASGQTIAVTNATATNLNAAVVGTGTAGTPAGNLLTVQGAASMTPVLTSTAPVSTAALGIVPVVSTALETGHVIKGSAGNLYGLNVTSTTVAGIVQIFNSTTVPAAGAVTPIKAYQLPAASALVIGFDPPLQCSTGICVAFSIATTPFTKTDSATAFISGDAV